jgi:hypothetical protein
LKHSSGSEWNLVMVAKGTLIWPLGRWTTNLEPQVSRHELQSGYGGIVGGRGRDQRGRCCAKAILLGAFHSSSQRPKPPNVPGSYDLARGHGFGRALNSKSLSGLEVEVPETRYCTGRREIQSHNPLCWQPTGTWLGKAMSKDRCGGNFLSRVSREPIRSRGCPRCDCATLCAAQSCPMG